MYLYSQLDTFLATWNTIRHYHGISYKMTAKLRKLKFIANLNSGQIVAPRLTGDNVESPVVYISSIYVYTYTYIRNIHKRRLSFVYLRIRLNRKYFCYFFINKL